MRPELVIPPKEDASLASLPVHVLVRDFAEALPVLRNEGVDVRARGGGLLKDAGEGVAAVLARALEWRREV